MKCLITGCTRGIGFALYKGLLENNHVAAGVSKSTGFDIVSRYDELIEKAQDYDLFINNAYYSDVQVRLLNDLNNKVKNIITIGSTAGYYTAIQSRKNEYINNKNSLINLVKRLSYTSTSNLLLLNVGLTENASAEPGCTYKDIVDTCLFWLKMPNIYQIDFSIKLSPANIGLIENDFDINLSNHADKFF